MNKRVCVVGGGRWGKNHIKTLHGLGALAGIVESDENTLNELKGIYPDVEVFGNVKDAVKRNFDGFTVATPAETHFELARFVMENGRHLLVEKPISLKADEARAKAKTKDGKRSAAGTA